MTGESIRVVLLPTRGQPLQVKVRNDANGLHKLIGGFFEVFYLDELTTDPMDSVIGLCDDDGWRTQLPNPYSLLFYKSVIAGPIVLTRAHPSGEFIDLTDADVSAIFARTGGYVAL